MTEFTPLLSLLGGALIGLSAVLLMAFHGRIAGMTGILARVLPPLAPGWQTAAAFLAGAALAPLASRAERLRFPFLSYRWLSLSAASSSASA